MNTTRLIIILAAIWLLPGCSSATNSALPTAKAALSPSSSETARSAQATEPAPPSSPLPTARVATSASAAPTAGRPSITDRVALWNLPERGRHPYALAMLGSRLFALNTETNNIAIVENGGVTRFIPLGQLPVALAANPAKQMLYVSTSETKSISLITNDHITLTRDLGETVRSLLFFEDRLFVGLDSRGAILVLDPLSLETRSTITPPGAYSIIRLAGDPVHHRVYASLYDRTAVIDSRDLRIASVWPTEGGDQTLAADPTSDAILASTYDSNTRTEYLIAYDPATGAQRGKAKIGEDSADVVVSSDGSRAYVANSYSNDVTVINPHEMSVIATIQTDWGARSLALDEKAHRLYVGNYESDSITAIDTDSNNVQATIPLAPMPTAMVANESSGRVYLANASTDSVYIIQGSQLVKEVGVGHHPRDLARDPNSKRVFVANAADGTVSIIDEADLSVRTTEPITQSMFTVAVDSVHSRLIAGGVLLSLADLKPVGSLVLSGMTLNSGNPPLMVRTNPKIDRIYAMASNGVPGSNYRYTTYTVDGATLKQRAGLGSSGNTTAMEIDPEANREFNASTHPLAYTNELSVFDANDSRILTLPMPARTLGMVYNPQTHHLFLSHLTGYPRSYGPTPVPSDDIVEILDTTSFGVVGHLTVPFPGVMTRVGNTVYVAGREDGAVTVIEDAAVLAPPSPTPTLTPTPWPTSTRGIYTATWPTITPTRRPSVTPTVSPATTCTYPLAPAFSSVWTHTMASLLGCSTGAATASNFAMRPFEHGSMFYRAESKSIFVLYDDKTWQSFNDTWQDPQAADSCPSISVPAGRQRPTRGFGKVWCTQSGVRNKIGAATGDEVGLYAAPFQTFQRGLVMVGPQSSQVMVLYNDGHWE